MNVYAKMGLPGCVGSTDVVHVKWDRCPVRLYHLCKGKEGYPSLAIPLLQIIIDEYYLSPKVFGELETTKRCLNMMIL